eukprot:COSAG05_NODE_509_length_9130_cov_3.978740_2_plen_109_part_00
MPANIIYAPTIMQGAIDAVTKIQTLIRSKRAKQTIATLRSDRVRDRAAYKSYLTSHTQDNSQGLQGWAASTVRTSTFPSAPSPTCLREDLQIEQRMPFFQDVSPRNNS